MKRLLVCAMAVLVAFSSSAQDFRTDSTRVLTLEDALRIALSENVAVKVADKEIQRARYAKKGSYAALFPQVDGTGSFMRTIKKQVMYMDFDMSEMMGGLGALAGGSSGASSGSASGSESSSSKGNGGGIEVL